VVLAVEGRDRVALDEEVVEFNPWSMLGHGETGTFVWSEL
jgi:hypothetical protein